MPGARRRRLGREAAASPPARAPGQVSSATATAVAAESGPPSRPALVPQLARLRWRCARPGPLRGRRLRSTSSGLARHCNRSASRHARRVMKRPRRRRSLAPLGIRPRRPIGAKVNGGRFTWPKFDQKKKKKKINPLGGRGARAAPPRPAAPARSAARPPGWRGRGAGFGAGGVLDRGARQPVSLSATTQPPASSRTPSSGAQHRPEGIPSEGPCLPAVPFCKMHR